MDSGRQQGAYILINGIVQGVGFRPFIHRLVKELSLNGFIRNTATGVELEIEGDAESLKRFIDVISHNAQDRALAQPDEGFRKYEDASPITKGIERVSASASPCDEYLIPAPPASYIEEISVGHYTALKGYTNFEIRESSSGEAADTLIAPDLAVCDDCLKELFDPADKRHLYPFINCTNCGPRFTIVKDIPYDRKNTTMAGFKMCESCAAEYTDIENRRYHAQPNCCADCGPKVWLAAHKDATANGLPKHAEDHTPLTGNAAINEAAGLLAAGRIVAIKGIGGFHLACRADDKAAVNELRKRKQRDEKPFAVMVDSIETVRKICHIGEAEEKALCSARRPIVLLEKKDKNSFMHISENNRLGIMLPYTPLHYLLFKAAPSGPAAFDAKGTAFNMLVMTSANISDEPILYKNEDAVEKLAGIADAFLLHNRDIEAGCDDSLLLIFDGKDYPLRRSRGYVPAPLSIGRATPAAHCILACGAEQKASFALLKGNHVFQCQHIGDLKNAETLDHYEKQEARFERLFDISPSVIACDLHPDYLSSLYAEKKATRSNLIRVQHHHAHMATCMADNGLNEPVIGIIWDGTGMGGHMSPVNGTGAKAPYNIEPDGTVWGGEFLVGDYSSFTRKGTIVPFKLPGGDKATRELWRTALSVLNESLGANGEPGNIIRKKYDAEKTALIEKMLASGINCPTTTSIGRLFDAAASLLGIRDVASYEGQGAVLLEALATTDSREILFPYDIIKDDIYYFDYRPMIRSMVSCPRASEEAALMFMNTLVDMAIKMSLAISADTGIKKVVLSGGVFQNHYLLKELVNGLGTSGLSVFHHSRVATNDEGIAVGQAMVAASLIEEK